MSAPWQPHPDPAVRRFMQQQLQTALSAVLVKWMGKMLLDPTTHIARAKMVVMHACCAAVLGTAQHPEPPAHPHPANSREKMEEAINEAGPDAQQFGDALRQKLLSVAEEADADVASKMLDPATVIGRAMHDQMHACAAKIKNARGL